MNSVTDHTRSDYRLDEIDRRIVHALMGDARNTSAPSIAEEVNVSGATIRNRIAQLEEHGILTGYHAAVDFEQAEGRMTNLFMCHIPFAELELITPRIGSIPGVIDVRELMGGRMNLHVLAVGESTSSLRRIGRELAELGAEIEDEMLVQNEQRYPYAAFGPADGERQQRLADFISLAGGAEVVEITVHEDAPIDGFTLERAAREGLLDEETLVIAIERDDAVLTPHGDTDIRSDDVVTLFSRGGIEEGTITAFHGPNETGRVESVSRS